MRRFTFVILLLTFCAPASADETQIQKATNVVNEIMSTPDKGIPRDLLNKAVCVGIIPSELKGAFLIGGTYGRGVLVCRDRGTPQGSAISPLLANLFLHYAFDVWLAGNGFSAIRRQPVEIVRERDVALLQVAILGGFSRRTWPG